RTNHLGKPQMVQSLDRAIEVARAFGGVGPGCWWDGRGAAAPARAHALPPATSPRMPAAAEAHRLRAAAQRLIVADAAAPEAYVGGFEDDRGRDYFRGRSVGEDEPLIELAGLHGWRVLRHGSGDEANPYPLQVTAEAIIARPVVDFDEVRAPR